MTSESEHIMTKTKDFLFPIQEWGTKKVRTTAVCMATTMLITWLICDNFIPNKPNEPEIQ